MTNNNTEIPPLHSARQSIKGQCKDKPGLTGLRAFLRREPSPLESSSSSDEDFRARLVEDFSDPVRIGRVMSESVAGMVEVAFDAALLRNWCCWPQP